MAPPVFAPGGTFSVRDAGILAAGVVTALLMTSVRIDLGALVLLPLVHFFLFCNVFRVARSLELAWAAGFLVLAIPTVLDLVDASLAAVASCTLGAIVIAIELRKPSYHGVLWQRVNPGLRRWWDDHHA